MFIPLHDANRLRHIRSQYVTFVIIAINIAVWLFMGNEIVSDEKSIRAAIFSYGFIPAVVNGYEALPPELVKVPSMASYFTYAFLHGDVMHLGGNMLFIWVFGDNVEDAMGHLRFIAFYLLCAAAGALAHGLTSPDSTAPLIGASGAAAGIITAYVMLHPRVKVWILALGRIPLRLTAFWIIGAWILFQLANFLFPGGEPVSWIAHIGGIAAGAILLPLLKRSDVPLFDRQPAQEVLAPLTPLEDEEEEPAPRRHLPWGRQSGPEN